MILRSVNLMMAYILYHTFNLSLGTLYQSTEIKAVPYTGTGFKYSFGRDTGVFIMCSLII